MSLLNEFKKIRGFVFDMDGVLTDGSVLLLDDGQMARTMYIRDGYALQLAVKTGYLVAVISGGASDGARLRLNKLGVTNVYFGVNNKQEIFETVLRNGELKAEELLFMGDDIPDYEVMQAAGLPCCPADAAPEIKAISKYISQWPGGRGCVRDVIEKVLKLNEHWNHETSIASR